MSWCQIGTTPSATIVLNGMWPECHLHKMNHSNCPSFHFDPEFGSRYRINPTRHCGEKRSDDVHRTWICDSSLPSAAYIRQWTGPALVLIMACRLFGAKPLPEPMLLCCQLDSWDQISVKFEFEFCHFHSRTCILNCRLPKWRPFCPVGFEVIGCRSSAKPAHAAGRYSCAWLAICIAYCLLHVWSLFHFDLYVFPNKSFFF